MRCILWCFLTVIPIQASDDESSPRVFHIRSAYSSTTDKVQRHELVLDDGRRVTIQAKVASPDIEIVADGPHIFIQTKACLYVFNGHPPRDAGFLGPISITQRK